MPMGPAIKHSSPSATTLLASDYGKVVSTRVGVIRSAGHNCNIQFARPSCPKISGHLNYTHESDHHHHHLQQRRKPKFVVKVGSDHHHNTQDSEVHPQTVGKSLRATFNILRRYTRFYALRGAVLAVISSSLFAIQALSDFTPSFFHGLLQAIIGGCLANLFVVSINQVADIEIDKINKPYLPLTSGELSVQTGILLTTIYAFLGFCLALYVPSWPLKFGLLAWYAYGFGYSVDLPLLRWKATPVPTLTSIWLFNGVLIPILFYLHAQVYIFGRPLLFSTRAIFSFGLLSIYVIVISLFKDLSDVEGDVRNGVKTFASQFGQRRIFWLCIWLLEMAFGMAILIGLSSARPWVRSITAISHTILGLILWKYANMADLNNKKDFESFYMLLWKLHYAEYALLPILRL